MWPRLRVSKHANKSHSLMASANWIRFLWWPLKSLLRLLCLKPIGPLPALRFFPYQGFLSPFKACESYPSLTPACVVKMPAVCWGDKKHLGYVEREFTCLLRVRITTPVKKRDTA